MQEAFNLCTSLLQLLSTEDHYQAQENPMGTTSVRSKISGLIYGSKLMTIVIPLKLMFLMYQQMGMLFCTKEHEPLFDIYMLLAKFCEKYI